MSYAFVKNLTTVNRNISSGREIKYIVIHYTGNKNDTAKANSDYFKSVNRGASAHYFVDSKSVYQIVEDKDIAWSVGKNYGSNNLFGIVNNKNSISIEMCSNDGKISDATFANVVELTKKLMATYNIPVNNVVRHFDVCSKRCPGWNGWGTKSGDSGILWEKFKNQLSSNPYPHYRAHVQSHGWMDVQNAGGTAGTTGQALRMEAIKIDDPYEKIQVKAHIQSDGDVDYGTITSDTVIGTTGEAKRLEAIYIKGNLQFRVHQQSVGWTPWADATNGAWLGSKGQSLRLEAIEIKNL